MVQLVLLLEAAQDRDGVLHGGLVDEDGLEAALQGGVLLDIFPVFIERGRADAMQLAARQRRLQQVAGIHAAFRGAGADQRVHLVDEQDDLAVGVLDLVEHGLEPFLELAAVLGAGDQRAHVERHQAAVLEAVRHVAIGDAQGQALGDGGLAGAGLADEDGIVLGPPGKDLHRAADFLVAADHRVELALAGRLGQVAGVLGHRLIGVLRAGAVGGLAAGHFLDRRFELLGIDIGRLERLAGRRVAGKREGLQNALHRHEAVACLAGQLFRLVERAQGIVVETGRLLRPAPRHRRDLRQRGIDGIHRRLGIAAGALDQPCGHALAVFEQRLQQVLSADLLVAVADRHGQRALDETLGAVGKLFQVHRIPSKNPFRH